MYEVAAAYRAVCTSSLINRFVYQTIVQGEEFKSAGEEEK